MFIYLVECPTWLDGWIDGRSVNLGCLYFNKNLGEMSFDVAYDYCKTLKYEHLKNGYLVEIYNSTQQTFLKEKIHEIDPSKFWWTGLTERETEGIWKWNHTGNIATYFSWGQNAPYNWNRDEDCMTLYAIQNFDWNDTPCVDGIKYPICQFDF